MNINFKVIYFQLILSSFFLFVEQKTATAEPYLAVQNNQQCNACHVNPTGGGARNSYGNYYGSQVLPETPGNSASFDSGSLSETLRIGSDLRYNFSNQTNTEAENNQGFDVQSAQLYFHLKPKDARFSLYIDEQVAPGAALNREAYVLLSLEGQNYLKLGRFFMPYGLRIEDDSSFIRQVTQYNFDNSDNGVELGLYLGRLAIHSVVSNGSSNNSNDDNQLHYLTRWEYLGNSWRVGSNLSVNDAVAGKRTSAGLYAGLNLWGMAFLAEWDSVRDESIQNTLGDDVTQQAGLLEVNSFVSKGVNLKVSFEYLDPDGNIDNDFRSRTSALVEYTPYANLQIRGGIRVSDDIPQRPQGNNNLTFVQIHMYY